MEMRQRSNLGQPISRDAKPFAKLPVGSQSAGVVKLSYDPEILDAEKPPIGNVPFRFGLFKI